MTAEQWINETLQSKIEGDVIRLNEQQTVLISTFCTFFRSSIEDNSKPDKYEALSGVQTFLWGEPQQEYNMTGGQLGYQPFLDEWHNEGLI